MDICIIVLLLISFDIVLSNILQLYYSRILVWDSMYNYYLTIARLALDQNFFSQKLRKYDNFLSHFQIFFRKWKFFAKHFSKKSLANVAKDLSFSFAFSKSNSHFAKMWTASASLVLYKFCLYYPWQYMHVHCIINQVSVSSKISLTG